MNSLNWVPLEERRAKSKLTTLFKTKLGAIDVPIEDLIVSQSKTRRKNTNYFVPQSSVDSHLHSFFPSSIRLWNSIPDNVKACNTIAGFKSNLQKITVKASYNQCILLDLRIYILLYKYSCSPFQPFYKILLTPGGCCF